MHKHDLVFMKRFSMVVGFLAVVAVLMLILAHALHGTLPPTEDPRAADREQQRIAPIGAVYAGSTGAAAMAAAAEAAKAAAGSQVAYGGTTDGAVIFTNLCGSCHTGGVAGAPKLEKSAWTARIAQGVDTVHKHAIEGFQGDAGMMPAKGGNPALTDEQVIATVDWMLDNLK